mgnify:CR=1 FL=1
MKIRDYISFALLLLMGLAFFIYGSIAEQDRARYREQLDAVIQFVKDSTVPSAILSSDNAIKAWSDSAADELGYSQEFVIGKSIDMFVPTRDEVEKYCPEYLDSFPDYTKDSMVDIHSMGAEGLRLSGRHVAEVNCPFRAGTGVVKMCTMRTVSFGDGLYVQISGYSAVDERIRALERKRILPGAKAGIEELRERLIKLEGKVEDLLRK